MATTNNNYSDLIHLFIDGEATEPERNALFGALKDSPELQEEFSSAMELKKAFAADIMQLQPPTYLQSQIAERAGLIVAASASVATAPAVVNPVSTGISSALSSAAPIATTAVSKGLITLIIGTSVGVLSTIGVIKMTSNNDVKIATPAAAKSVTRQIEQVPQHSLVQAITPAPIATAEATLKNSSNESPVQHQVVAPEKREIKAQDVKQNASSVSIPKNIPVVEKAQVVEEHADNSSFKENTIAENILKPITITDAREPKDAIGDNGSGRGLFNPESNPAGSGVSRLSASIKGIGTLQFDQGRHDVTLPVWNNFGVGLKWDADPMNAFAIEAGQETFPIYLSNGKGGYDDHRSITWGGASWTYSAIYLQLFNTIIPEARALAGLSSAGPITKFSVGFVMPISNTFSFSTDFEQSLLFVNVNGNPTAGSKRAITGSLIFHF
ncbi:MAG: hypothetical protein Q8916_12050 [Bacteroidota bacterium]|nr:hypothetical protein [Bacteroidota bacterium]